MFKYKLCHLEPCHSEHTMYYVILNLFQDLKKILKKFQHDSVSNRHPEYPTPRHPELISGSIKFLSFKIITFLVLFLTTLSSVCAKEPNAYPELRKKIHIYLNGVHALVGDFHQHNADGTIYKGKIWLKRYKDRMGKMRLDYEPSVGQQIIALDDTLSIFDKDGNENTYNVDQTPAAFILRSNISFEKDLSITDIQKSPDGKHALITLTQKGDEDGPSLTLIFALTDNGGIARLAMWEVLDMQGNKTAVEILEETERINDMRLVDDKIFKASSFKK